MTTDLAPPAYLHEVLPALLTGNDRLRLGLVRRSWNPPEHTGYIVYTSSGYLMTRSRNGQRTDQWYPTAEDLMATDWEVWEAIPADAGTPKKR